MYATVRIPETTPRQSAGIVPRGNRQRRSQAPSGPCTAVGDGVPENYVVAYAWFNLAGAQGLERAQEAKSALSGLMTSEQVARAQELSIELLERINQP